MAADTVALYQSLLGGEIEGSAALQATQQMLSLVMDSIPIAIFWKDLDSRYLGCNKVFSDLAGLEPEEMIGKTDLDMPWHDHEAIHFRDWDRRVMDSGEPAFEIREIIHRRDGTALDIETNKLPLTDSAGRVIGLLGTSEDITLRLRAEEDVRQNLEVLDERVRLRTEELSRANATLRREVDERVRLQAEERQLRAHADAMRETAAAISSSLDFDEILEEILLGAERLLSHDLGAVVLLSEPSSPAELVHYRARFGYGPQASTTGQSLEFDILETIRSQLDAPLILEVGDDQGPRGLWQDAKALLAAPMKVGDKCLGFLVVESATAGLFDTTHIERLSTVADQAAAALSNAQLLAQTAEIAAVDERQRLARDLHDSVSQTLWTASLFAGSLSQRNISDKVIASEVASIKRLTSGAVAEMRTLLLELRPRALEDASLDDLIDQLIIGFESRRSIDVHTDLAEIRNCPPEAKVALYRIAQEALNNVSRHSHATSLTVMLTRAPTGITLTIIDDGRGFDAGRPGGHGHAIMQERVDAIGAKLTIDSTLGSGTRLQVIAPIETVQP